MPDISTLGAITAFGAGIVSFLSPCVLPLVPGYVSYIAGQSLAGNELRDRDLRDRGAAVVLATFFVLGFSTVFILLGASASAAGRLLLSYRYETNLVGGAIVIGFGLLMMGAVRVPVLGRDFRFHASLKGGRPFPAYVLGLAFGFGWTPCIGPVLGAILTASAVSATLAQGVGLLGFYSLGLGVPFLAAALFTETFLARMRAVRRHGARLQLAAGGVMVIMGLAMVTGRLTAFSYWILETFPAFATVG
ncbi:MAG: cytochrome c biogenesis protein CcdA [Proteobacteria bacterium]|nr:cytochrome c biogenesis protein CcdA [Pseudomonadota bacterium]